MRSYGLLALVSVLVSAACMVNYDIDEVAPPEHLGDDHDHLHHDHDHDDCEVRGDGHHHEGSLDAAGLTGSSMHIHEPDERNHGTEWFFNQPWAAGFVWGKMLRDSIVLLVLAASVLLFSRRRRRRL